MIKKIGIIGGGPCGLTMGLFCHKYNIDFKIYEKNSTLNYHPAAHYLNFKTLEIFNGLFSLDNEIYKNSIDLNTIGKYYYLRRIDDMVFHIDNHFKNYDLFINNINREYTFSRNCHIPQNSLLKILFKKYKELNLENKIFFNSNINIKKDEKFDINNENFDYIIGTDGFNSYTRSFLNINLKGKTKTEYFKNIYFFSKKLKNLILEKNINGMLYFIFNSDIVCCLINHNYNINEFVLQIPVHKNINLNEDDNIKIINKITNIDLDDINIKNVNFWKLNGSYAENYFNENIILAGDSCHSFPPAGGFGLNTGINDVNYLINILNTSKDLKNYEQTRKSTAKKLLDKSNDNYNKTLEFSKSLGLDINNLNTYNNIFDNYWNFLPNKKNIYTTGIKLGTMFLENDFLANNIKNNLKLNNNNKVLDLVYPEYEYFFKNEDYKIFNKEKFSENYKLLENGHDIPHIKLLYKNKELSLKQIFQYYKIKEHIVISNSNDYDLYLNNDTIIDNKENLEFKIFEKNKNYEKFFKGNFILVLYNFGICDFWIK